MRSGLLSSVISVEKDVGIIRNGTGNPVRSWASQFTRRASIQYLAGDEGVGNAAIESEQKYKIRVRHDSSTALINVAEFRIVLSGKVLDINSIRNPSERNRELHLYCTERPSATYK